MKPDYRAILDELVAIWERDADDDEVEVRADVAHLSVPVIVRALVAHAVECARGILILYRNRLPLPAMPLIRSLMEDALTAGWVLADPDGWRSFISDTAKQKRGALREMLDLDPDHKTAKARLDEMNDLINSLGPASGHHINQRAKLFTGAERFYLTYRAASTLTHAGGDIVDLYTETDPRSPVGFVYRPHPAHTNAGDWIGIAAMHLLYALTTWDTCKADHPDQHRLYEIADTLGVTRGFIRKSTD